MEFCMKTPKKSVCFARHCINFSIKRNACCFGVYYLDAKRAGFIILILDDERRCIITLKQRKQTRCWRMNWMQYKMWFKFRRFIVDNMYVRRCRFLKLPRMPHRISPCFKKLSTFQLDILQIPFFNKAHLFIFKYLHGQIPSGTCEWSSGISI